MSLSIELCFTSGPMMQCRYSSQIFHCDCCGVTGSQEFVLDHLRDEHRFNQEEAENAISPAPQAEIGVAWFVRNLEIRNTEMTAR